MSFVAIDGSGSSRTSTIYEERLAVIEDIAHRTALCNGRLTVTGFSVSSSATVTLLDHTFAVKGSTDRARARKAPEAVEPVMEDIRASYDASLASLSNSGTDVLGAYQQVADYKHQLPTEAALEATILTDGLQNMDALALDPANLDRETTESLVEDLDLPDLAGVTITLSGVGQVSGTPLTSTETAGLIEFYDLVCQNTNAASCLTVTDWR
ncbi:hypothetical protein [Gulosibacter molinativorax]|uniref:VWA domain-containing protein n=1 Tax=Gulosibacter molinativorax TaxID=256821 RepID=A0ABT7CBT0_9MICO|nr:hypothetical protein [Gulosibacter molinativorax]MDJ1372653.1 hypothetical protein [Gulosibacter molinativorax]